MWYTFPCRKVRSDSVGAFCILGLLFGAPSERLTPKRSQLHSKNTISAPLMQAPKCLCISDFRTNSRKSKSRTKGAKMPSYQNAVPPSSLFPGDVGFSFNNETFPGSAQAGSQFAIPSYAGQPDTGTAVRWQTIFGTAPTAVSLILQGAMADVDTEYQTIDTTTNTAGEARTVNGVQARFLRIKFSSSTGGSGLTAKLLV